jgi:hypothetical protein
LLSLGLSYGLLQLSGAVLRGMNMDTAGGSLGPIADLALFQGLQILALLAGGMLAGAGQTRGTSLGAMVGVLSGLLFIAGMLNGTVTVLVPGFARELLTPGTTVRNLTLYGLPVLHAVFGALGGQAGSAIWCPLPSSSRTWSTPAGSSALPLIRAPLGPSGEDYRDLLAFWSGPVAWARVVVGTLVAVGGAVWTRSIIDLIVLASQGRLSIATMWENQVACGEVFTLSILIGGCIAGANTLNGVRQGFWVGIAAAALLTCLFLSGALHPVGGAPAVLSTLFFGPIGGWFGSELLPPVYHAPRRRGAAWF